MTYEAHKTVLWRSVTKILLVGVAFLVLSFAWPDAMSPNVYGARAHAVPAEVWALGFISAAGLVIYGLHINGRMPLFTPLLRLVGLAFLFAQFGYLAYSALFAPDGEVVLIFSVLFFMPDLWHHARIEAMQLAYRWRLARDVAR